MGQPVAILGCGPAGLFAAEAVASLGHQPVIFSRKVKSTIPGSQYLHKPIPDLCPVYPDNLVQYVRMGTAEGYAEKVYDDATRNTGWDAYSTLYPSWNVIRAYDSAWNKHQHRIESTWINADELRVIQQLFDLVITTLPAQEICENEEHNFEGSPYWIQTLPVPYVDRNKDLVIYNGMPADHWYRWSILSGVCSIETTKPPLDWQDDLNVKQGTKAGSTDCDCHPNVVRVGRWAQWKHGVLLNDAYDKTLIETARRLR